MEFWKASSDVLQGGHVDAIWEGQPAEILEFQEK